MVNTPHLTTTGIFLSIEANDYLQQAMQQHREENLYDADRLYAQALQLEPDNVQTLRLKGILAREMGNASESLKLLEQLAELNPDAAEPLNEIALTHMAVGAISKAEQLLRRALEKDPTSINAHSNFGALLHQRGNVRQAINCYRAALELQPDEVELRCNLAKALSDAGEQESAIEECDTALSHSNEHPFVKTVKGAVLLDQENYTAARDILTDALEQGYAEDMSMVNLALAHYQTSDRDAAIDILRQAVELNPLNARAVADLANCYSATKLHAEAIELCENFLQQSPGERLVVGAYALALHNAGHTEKSLALTDCDQLVRVFDIPVPLGFADINVFNNALSALIRADTSLLTNPVSKATFGGDQTGELDMGAALATLALLPVIQDCVSKAANHYLDAGLGDHPVMAPASGSQTIRAWGTVLRAGGRQTAHMHPLGWLSGVYYAHLPAEIKKSATKAGWLEFNIPAERFYRETETSASQFEPREGRLLLFPSWFWHQTLPFTAEDDRISIAFDVVPVDALRML
jgi:tetratricopeptide (TPR) repeat protein